MKPMRRIFSASVARGGGGCALLSTLNGDVQTKNMWWNIGGHCQEVFTLCFYYFVVMLGRRWF